MVDPITGKEAEVLLDQSCIDVEKLLLRAISCHRYTGLQEIQKNHGENGQICQAMVILFFSPAQKKLILSRKKYFYCFYFPMLEFWQYPMLKVLLLKLHVFVFTNVYYSN